MEKLSTKPVSDEQKQKKRIQNVYQKQTSSKVRLLQSINEYSTLKDLGFFDLKQDNNQNKQLIATQTIFSNLKKDSSHFILYPFKFNYKKDGQDITQIDGGVFSLDQSLIPTNSINKILNITNVNLHQAKALYDTDIAILSIPYILEDDSETDLFTEASQYCQYFQNTLKTKDNCLRGISNLNTFKQTYPTKGAVVYVNHTDIIDGVLLDETTEKINLKLLIIPDYLIKSDSIIDSYITPEVISKIIKFKTKGGHILVSGKSGYLLEKWGILQTNTYDISKTLSSKGEKGIANIKGCETIKIDTEPNINVDYFKQLICFTTPETTKLSTTYPMLNIPNNFEKLMYFTNTNKNLAIKENGYEQIINDVNKIYPYILTSKEVTGEGRIMIVNGSPIQNTDYIEPILNFILYSMTQNIILDVKVKFNINDNSNEDLPIPGGEENLQLNTYFNLQNLFSKEIQNIELVVLKVPNTMFVLPEGIDKCTLLNDDSYSSYNLKGFDSNQYLKCTITKLNQFEKYELSIKIEIKDQSVTQKGTDIPLFYTILKYKDTETQKENMIENCFKVQAALAAILRGTINPDPSGFYPVLGKGVYFDTALNVENKENTKAFNVKFIGIVPLISPLVDGSDQQGVSVMCPVYDGYYRNHNYTYAWTDVYNREEDYIDYQEIKGKGIVHVSDWDTPVKISKVSRESLKTQKLKNKILNLYEPVNDDNIQEENENKLKTTNSETLLREIYYGDADKFYERASQRDSLFVDTRTPQGAKALYGDSIPDTEKDPHNPSITKVEFAFIRADLFLYESDLYQKPNGWDHNMLITIDKYDQSSQPKTNDLFLSKKAKKLVYGHYNSSKPKYETLKPNEYSNVLREYSYLDIYNLSNPSEINRLIQKSEDKVKLTHYIVPVKYEGVEYADSIKYFKLDDSGKKSGYMEEYPLLKFIYGHIIKVTIKPENTRTGGYIEIKLPSGIQFKENDPVDKDKISISADNIAVYKTTFENEIIKIYFKRGLMPNESYGKPSKCEVYLEDLNSENDINEIPLTIYQVKYDFSSPSLESYELADSEIKVTGKYSPLWSLPALYIENTLKRKKEDENEYHSDMKEYELMNPFARYGGYFQELTRHTTVWGSAEAHHRTDPGYQTINEGHSILSLVGTSFIPFAEFVTHGKSLLIPGATSTSRLEWNDVWGRHWVQNLRSIYPDIPPIPAPVMSFMMTTTYELISEKTQQRVLEWNSDENVYIHVQMKFLNNYFKYFEPVMCNDNKLPFHMNSATEVRNPEFLGIPNSQEAKTLNADDYMISLGINSTYGMCYSTSDSVLSGKAITPNIYEEMKKMMTCANSGNITEMNECSKKSDELALPLLKRRTNNSTEKWNYSPLIEKYYPKGYINEDIMWDLTKETYYDDAFMKAYPFHLDNNLPGIDVAPTVNPTITKPNDFVAFPIFKGLGYKITYDPNYKINKYPKYHGWWSDQLQNKDHTLIAGQEKSNEVSVGQESLLKDSDWIHGRSIKLKNNQTLIETRFHNIYVCKYNQYRIKINPQQEKYAWPYNVYINNVIPIEPDLEEFDERLTNFDCSNFYMYSPYNISLVDNRVYTATDRDWLYFAVNLRGEAKENINVIMKLEPFKETKYEGITKVQDGGRFTYWQPPNGPNSFIYTDSNVNTVLAYRVDLTLDPIVLPSNVYTFKSEQYHIFKIYDENEKNREYTMSTYMNSYGYGDSVALIYVGGIESSECKVKPGSYTIAKITLYNNAGFDWNILKGGIEYDENDYGYPMILNANSALFNIVSNIRNPTKYNFITFEIPDSLKNYITINPSDVVEGVSPQFYDLSTNNVVRIRDAFEGDYYVKIEISNDFPDEFKGKMFDIPIKLNKQYFDRLPNYNDPTGIHGDVDFKIPNLRLGVPISEGKENAGKVFDINGQASEIDFSYYLLKEFEIQDFKFITENDLTNMREITSEQSDVFKRLSEYWNNLSNIDNWKTKVNYKLDKIDSSWNKISINLKQLVQKLPYPVQEQPYQSEVYLAFKTYASQLKSGYINFLKNSKVEYSDSKKMKTSEGTANYLSGRTSGPYLIIDTENKILKLSENNTYIEITAKNEKIIYKGDKKVIKVTVTLKNSGTATSYHNNFEINISDNAQLLEDNGKIGDIMHYTKTINNDNSYTLHVNYNGEIVSSDFIAFDLLFNVKIPSNNRNNLRYLTNSNEIETKIIKSVTATLCKTSLPCEPTDPEGATQSIDVDNVIVYYNKIRNVGTLSLTVSKIDSSTLPKYSLTAQPHITDPECFSESSDCHISKIKYQYYRKIEGIDTNAVLIHTSDSNTYIDTPLTEEQVQADYNVIYYVIGLFPKLQRTITGKEYSIKSNSSNSSDNNEKSSKQTIKYVAIIAACLLVISIVSFLIYKLKQKEISNIGKKVSTSSKTNIESKPKTKSNDIEISQKAILKENKVNRHKKITIDYL